jgi:diacylglycerol kinase family enzyme
VNEAVNGLAGSSTPLTCLPGGRTNVYCRMLGIPHDIVDSTEHLLRMADAFEPRCIDLPRVNDRHFAFSSGVGLDARVVERVDAHPWLKRNLGEWYFTWTGLSTFMRRYALRPPGMEVEVVGETVRGVLVVVQKAKPYTYFDERPIDVAEGAALHSGEVAAVVLERANPVDVPTIVWRAFSSRSRMRNHRQIRSWTGLDGLRVRSVDGTPLPIQVDGDFIGESEEAVYAVTPQGLTVVS